MRLFHVTSTILLALLTGVTAQSATLANQSPDASQWLVVDCLLPGQVRKLGGSMSYLSARRAVKTTGADCEIRGGEYTAYDRGNYQTALQVWRPLAEGGDAKAQTYVGEIYEKGLGAAPDYAAAAQWYRKAADQGDARALNNLGFLYEKGLGVAQDKQAALALYRRASGQTGVIALDESPARATDDRRIKQLEAELTKTRGELERARKELDLQRKRLDSETRKLERTKDRAAQAGDSAEVQRLVALLSKRNTELVQHQNQAAELDRQLAAAKLQMQAVRGDAEGLRVQIALLQNNLRDSATELEQRRKALQDAQRSLDATSQQLERERQNKGSNQAEVQRLEGLLTKRERDLREQSERMQRSEKQAAEYRTQLAQIEPLAKKTTAKLDTAKVDIAAPSIQLIDPTLVTMRGGAKVEVRGGISTREIVGKVSAPGGLYSFKVNDRNLTDQVDQAGLFKFDVPLTSGGTPINLVVVDKLGKHSSLDFTLVQNSPAQEVKAVVPSGIDFGNYYALVIGNGSYQSLPKLATATADAKAVADELTKRYGFKTQLLLNANRYQILSELNKLRAKLNDKDNLLIYYAGHGELDKANLRGHWLPVDAEPNNDANWISNVAITDILNAMTVRHVLVVADSCYSGALTRSALGQIESGLTEEQQQNYLKAMVKSRSRTVLTSGGMQPVLDGGGGEHSVFAKSFLEVLHNSRETLEGRRLHLEISARVLTAALRYRIEQVPEYAPIKYAGHEAGDFVFIPRTP